jgi:hypothetical protein
MDARKLDRLVNDLADRYAARDADGVNKLWDGLSEEDKEAVKARMNERGERMREETERNRAATDEMLRLSGQTREEFEAEMREADKGKLSLFRHDDTTDAEKYRLLQADVLLSRFYKAHPEAEEKPQEEQTKMLEEWAAKNISGQIEPTEEEAEAYFRKLIEQAKDETAKPPA